MILGAWEMAVVAMAALLFLGPDKMPELARKLAKLVSQGQGLLGEIRRSVSDALNEEERTKPHVHEPANRSVHEQDDAAFSDWVQQEAKAKPPTEKATQENEPPQDSP